MWVPHAAFLALLAMLAATTAKAAGDAGKPGLAVRFGPEGLKSISYAGKNLLAPESASRIDVYGTDGKPINLAGGGATQAKGVVTQKYDSLVVVTEMRQVKDVLNLTVTFKLGTDSDMAQVLVQNRVSLALPVIPALVQNEGITVKKQ